MPIALLASLAPLAAGTDGSGRRAQDLSGLEPVAPLVTDEILDQRRVDLGGKLFNDVRLSRGNAVSCASCHDLEQGGDDGRDRPTGTDGQPLEFNSPTVFNAARNFRLNWRGNYRTLEEQNEAVLLDPRLMGSRWDDLLAKLRADPGYAPAFNRIYSETASRESVLDALATFQRSLVTPHSRFDRFLAGERDAITPAEERGYRAFDAFGCIACHQGENLGGNLFQKFGIFATAFPSSKAVAEADLGRFAITGKAEDRHVFRVPSLRNVAATAPYLHDGRAASLDAAVKIMARNQLGRELPDGDVDLIVGFLRTLTGEYLGRPLVRETGPGPR